MPKFHFYLHARNGRKHIGSLDLPSQAEVIPAGLKRTTEILATIVRQHPEEDGIVVEAVDDSGALVYNFNVSKRPSSTDMPSSSVH